MNFIFVALGGALGAVLRYSISLLPNSTVFPIWTLVTNFIGAVIIGFTAQLALKKNLSDNTILFLKTGICGGFTTFSAFSLEAYELFKKEMPTSACLYIVCSVGLCLLGIAIGTWLANLTVK